MITFLFVITGKAMSEKSGIPKIFNIFCQNSLNVTFPLDYLHDLQTCTCRVVAVKIIIYFLFYGY